MSLTLSLLAYANSSDPANKCRIWIQTVWHSDSVPQKKILKNFILKKKSVDDSKTMKNTENAKI